MRFLILKNEEVIIILIIKTICLFTGYIIWFCILCFALYFLYHFVCILLRRPWQCIKHLLPWFWIDEDHWNALCRAPKMWRKLSKDDYRAYVYYKRYGRLGIMYSPKHEYWYQPIRHFFIIKTIKE